MISFSKRVLISIASTTLLHASIFYSLHETNPKKEDSKKFVEIALLDSVKVEKQEQSKAVVKKEQKPPQKQKKEPKQQTIKSKPQPIIKAETTSAQQNIVVAKNESVEQKPTQEQRTGNTNSKESEEATASHQKRECLPSKVNPSELEIYLSKIRAKIQANLKYPALAKRLKLVGESIVKFEILEDGGIKESSLQIKHSSGHKSFDEQAIEAVLSVTPFEKAPMKNMSITVPIVFELN